MLVNDHDPQLEDKYKTKITIKEEIDKNEFVNFDIHNSYLLPKLLDENRLV